MISETHNMDCMDFMRGLPDGFFDLAVVDPNYGIGEDGKSNHSRGKPFVPKGLPNRAKGVALATKYTPKEWDKMPVSKYTLNEILRVSKNQIIWGANHFISRLPYDSPSWVVWDKMNGESDFADCELAWTSFKTAVRKFEFKWNGMLQHDMKNKEVRQHPTQKPVALYKWLLTNYAKPGHKIFDPMMGSQSSRIAAWDMGFDYWGCEMDAEYYRDGEARFQKHIAKPVLFAPQEMYSFEQIKLFQD